jgi:MFS-type transporter involved in bile tolerance (Atg22 family)
MELALEKAKVNARMKRLPVTRRERWAWYFYDFGNSAYAAVVLLAVYSAYFKNAVVGGSEGTRMWGISVGIAMLVVAFLSPVLGTLADFAGSKKKVLILLFHSLDLFYRSLILCNAGRSFHRHAVLYPGGNRLPGCAGVLQRTFA